MIDSTWLDAALTIWQRDRFVSPIMFAENDTRAVAAQPTSTEAMEIEGASKTLLISALAASINATYVGMVLEVWDREYRIGEAPERLERGALEQMADTDPSVHTAIVVPWAATDQSRSGIIRARHVLNAEGQPTWDRSEHTDIAGDIIDILLGIDEYTFHDTTHTSIAEAVDIICGALGWVATWWKK